VPLLACVLGVLLIAQKQNANLRAFGRGSVVSLLVLLSGVHLGVASGQEFAPENLAARGGMVGAGVAWALRRALGEAGACIALVAFAVVALLLLSEVSLAEMAGRAGGALGRSKDAWADKAEDIRTACALAWAKTKATTTQKKRKKTHRTKKMLRAFYPARAWAAPSSHHGAGKYLLKTKKSRKTKSKPRSTPALFRPRAEPSARRPSLPRTKSDRTMRPRPQPKSRNQSRSACKYLRLPRLLLSRPKTA
jgi:Sec-independent protein translocase protein TatA